MENDEARYRQEDMAPRFDRLANRHENGAAPRAVSAFNLFQTPHEIAADLARKLKIKPGENGLEPSCGLGRLLDYALQYSPGHIVAVEVAPNLAGEIFRRNPSGVSLIQRDFLTVSPDDFKPFDFVIMNPPFHMRADVAHIRHALKFLRPGGRLGAICMDTTQREAALKGIADSWVRLPAGTFKEEGTRVPSVMLTITKP